MLSLGIKGSRPRDRLTDPSRITQGARGLYPLGTLTRALGQRDQAEPKHALCLCSGLGGSPEPQAPDRRKLGPDTWLPPGLRRKPRPENEKVPLSHRGSRSTLALPRRRDSINRSLDRVMHGA